MQRLAFEKAAAVAQLTVDINDVKFHQLGELWDHAPKIDFGAKSAGKFRSDDTPAGTNANAEETGDRAKNFARTTSHGWINRILGDCQLAMTARSPCFRRVCDFVVGRMRCRKHLCCLCV